MKLKYVFLLLSTIFLIGCKEDKKSNLSESLSQKITSPELKHSKGTVEEAVSKLTDLLITPNEDELKSVVDDKLTYGHSSGKIQNKTEFIDDLLHGSFDFLSIELKEQSIDIVDNTAIVRHIFHSKAKNNEEPAVVNIGNVLVLVNKNGKWKLLARQAYKLPLK